MKDRVSANPGRVLVTPENGTSPFYATLSLADNPAVEGDKLNKNTLLKDTTAALYGLPNTATPDAVFAKIPAFATDRINTGWKLQYSKTTAGSFTWTAPDLFGGKPYYIGVLVIGGGGSGGASSHFDSSGAGDPVSGGASGYAISFVMLVTPGTTYSGVVGKGGASVTSTSASGASGSGGGTSSFNGKTAQGGFGGRVNTGALGGQCSWAPNVVQLDFVSPYGGVVVDLIHGSTYRSAGTPACCWNPFENKRILGAGGGASNNTAHVSLPGGKDPLNPSYGGGNGFFGNGIATAYAGNQPGCGGGAAHSKNGNTATSGKGADGAVMIYVQGVA